MADRQLLDEIMTLIIAGHETTASSLNWFWYLLALTPDVAARVAAEADAGGDAFPGYDDLAKYPYARRALDETLRMYPPGWLLTRRSIAASPLAGFALPAKCDVLISPYLIQRHPAFWPDPDDFDPDRFLTEVSATRNRFAYLPFGLGPARVHRRALRADRDARARRLSRAPFRADARARADGRDRAAGEPADPAAACRCTCAPRRPSR